MPVKTLVVTLSLLVGLLITCPVPAIDGDYSNPYVTEGNDAQRPGVPPPVLAPGERPVYGGRDDSIPLLVWTGALVALLGLGAVLYWGRRPAPVMAE